jgi:hypothetical protein
VGRGACCSDAVERFQLSVFLALIVVRNWTELGDDAAAAGGGAHGDYGLSTLLPQAVLVLLTELAIDWTKVAAGGAG